MALPKTMVQLDCPVKRSFYLDALYEKKTSAKRAISGLGCNGIAVGEKWSSSSLDCTKFERLPTFVRKQSVSYC